MRVYHVLGYPILPKCHYQHSNSQCQARIQPNGEVVEPPTHFAANIAACWREIVGFSHPGVLCRADRLIVEHAARILATLRAEQWRGKPALLNRFEVVLGKLGMSPADRSKVSIFKTKRASPYSEFG